MHIYVYPSYIHVYTHMYIHMTQTHTGLVWGQYLKVAILWSMFLVIFRRTKWSRCLRCSNVL